MKPCRRYGRPTCGSTLAKSRSGKHGSICRRWINRCSSRTTKRSPQRWWTTLTATTRSLNASVTKTFVRGTVCAANRGCSAGYFAGDDAGLSGRVHNRDGAEPCRCFSPACKRTCERQHQLGFCGWLICLCGLYRNVWTSLWQNARSSRMNIPMLSVGWLTANAAVPRAGRGRCCSEKRESSR